MRFALAWDARSAKECGQAAAARRGWNEIIRTRNGRDGSKRSALSTSYPEMGAGTHILEDRGGTTHKVLVTGDCAYWIGESYSFLSSVARAMTGTSRNGPKFFGLRESAKP